MTEIEYRKNNSIPEKNATVGSLGSVSKKKRKTDGGNWGKTQISRKRHGFPGKKLFSKKTRTSAKKQGFLGKHCFLEKYRFPDKRTWYSTKTLFS